MNKKPCKSSCPKCGNEKNIQHQFIFKNCTIYLNSVMQFLKHTMLDENKKYAEINTTSADLQGIPQIYAHTKKDCIVHYCNCCNYIWAGGVLNSARENK